MEISSLSKPHSVKNILIRHSCSTQALFGEYDSEHPEKFHIRKYFPKYYHSLNLEVSSKNPLLSKLKRVKKLKKFAGHLTSNLPQVLWFNLLGNNRKEIEEIPKISYSKPRDRLSPIFSKWFTRQKLKFFLKLKRIILPRIRTADIASDFDNFLPIKESLMKYIGNMKSLKSLKIMITPYNYDWVKEVLEKLNGMPILLDRLETLSFDVKTGKKNIQGLFQNNKKIFSYLTGLELSVGFDPIFSSISEICKNLKFLAINFEFSMNQQVDGFLQFLTCIQNLADLRNLEFYWPSEVKNFWYHFKPQPSLRYLKLVFNGSDLIREELFEEDVDPLGNWEFIQELDGLEFFISSCKDQKEMDLVKRFITTVLNKVCKLRSLKCSIKSRESFVGYEPFSVEEVPHLYERLERFEHSLSNWSWKPNTSSEFDLKLMEPFRNLKVLKLDGNTISYENIEDAVGLLEGSYKEGDFTTFELKLVDSDLLREILTQIQNAKRAKVI